MLIPLATPATATKPNSITAAAIAAEQVTIGAPGERMALVIWRPPSPTTTTPLPLIVMSHGTGAGPLAHVDTAEALAAAGFVVAAPMHRGDNFQDQSNVGKPQWMASRSRDIGNTVDYMLENWSGKAAIDASRIGIFGFSAGGTTALIAAGGVPDLARFAPHCAARREFVCDIAAPSREASASTPEWTHDPRITAAVVAAPGLGFLFEPTGLSNVRVPIQIWVGSHDDTVPTATNARLVQRLLASPPDFREVDGAVHLSFLAPCTADTPPVLCKDRDGFDRSAFHRGFNKDVVAFFRQRLPGPSHAAVKKK
jgi:predicted dienelactone hydrolase